MRKNSVSFININILRVHSDQTIVYEVTLLGRLLNLLAPMRPKVSTEPCINHLLCGETITTFVRVQHEILFLTRNTMQARI